MKQWYEWYEYESLHRLHKALNHPLTRRPLIWLIVALTILGGVLDVTTPGVSRWFGDHQFATAILAEALLLSAVYFGIDYFIKTSEDHRWQQVAMDSLIALHSDADSAYRAIAAAFTPTGRLTQVKGKVEYARKQQAAFSKRVDGNLALLTASPYMARFFACTLEARDDGWSVVKAMEEAKPQRE